MPSSMLYAATVNLYSGAVPVADQSQSEQERAMPPALEQVLQKLTGLRDFSEFPGVESAMQDARSMVISFYYDNKEMTLPDGSLQQELRFVANFSHTSVDGLIQAARLPIWNPERRPLTIWLVIDDGVSRRIMPIEFAYTWDRMADIAEARGMPVTRPQPDAEGKYSVDMQLLWGGYTEELAGSGPVNALIMAARREGPEWNVRMNLDYMGEKWSWRNRDTEIENALVEGLQTAIDDISRVNSISAADRGQWNFEITVNGLVAARDYNRCLSYLQGVSLVDRVRVSKAGPGWVHFVLGLNALPEYLVRTLASDGVLVKSSKEDEYSLQP